MDTKQQARLYSALGSEIRLKILDLVSSYSEMCVCELVDEMGLSQANISRHVGILRDAGLLQDRKIGTWVLLRVNVETLERCSGTLADRIRGNHKRSGGEDAQKRLEARCAVA